AFGPNPHASRTWHRGGAPAQGESPSSDWWKRQWQDEWDQSPPPLERKHIKWPTPPSGAPPGAPPAARGDDGGAPSSGSGSDSSGSGSSGSGSSGSLTSDESAVVKLTNQERAKAGCSALKVDDRLVTAARKHSEDMAANNYFSHNSQNGDDPFERMKAAGYPNPAAENIAMGYSSPEAVMEGWMNSSGHRRNILDCSLRTIGVGVAKSPRGPYWTQDFGR
ncbi:MAG: CAP domain-containing protein, partial [Actinomadura rubrobrunea]|nr:CAP domain-containing protein [Actinomadura rubrobrunea]